MTVLPDSAVRSPHAPSWTCQQRVTEASRMEDFLHLALRELLFSSYASTLEDLSESPFWFFSSPS